MSEFIPENMTALVLYGPNNYKIERSIYPKLIVFQMYCVE